LILGLFSSVLRTFPEITILRGFDCQKKFSSTMTIPALDAITNGGAPRVASNVGRKTDTGPKSL
jgi:hypothetical protein